MSQFNANKVIECFGGEGAPIVLVHGFGADRNSWLATAPELVKHAKVFTIELPGHGNAWDVPPADGLQQLSQQILIPAVSKIAAECGPVHLIGHSLGGALSMLATTYNAAMITTLSLIAPLGLGSGADTDFIEQFVELDDETAALHLLRRTVFNERLISSQLNTPLLSHLRKEGVRITLRALANNVLNPGQDLALAVEQISTSKIARQVIWGLDDKIIPLASADDARFGGQWHKLEECGHLPHVERRVQVNRLLLDIVHRSTGV